MENENENVEKSMENETDLVEALAKYKENSVPKEKYDKLVEENKRIINAFADGKPLSIEDEKPLRTREELIKVMTSSNTNNLEYAKAALELHKKTLEETGVNDFLPNGANYNVTDVDIKSAERFEEVLEQCIEEANGNSEVFTALLSSRTDDIKLPKKN